MQTYFSGGSISRAASAPCQNHGTAAPPVFQMKTWPARSADMRFGRSRERIAPTAREIHHLLMRHHFARIFRERLGAYQKSGNRGNPPFYDENPLSRFDHAGCEISPQSESVCATAPPSLTTDDADSTFAEDNSRSGLALYKVRETRHPPVFPIEKTSFPLRIPPPHHPTRMLRCSRSSGQFAPTAPRDSATHNAHITSGSSRERPGALSTVLEPRILPTDGSIETTVVGVVAAA